MIDFDFDNRELFDEKGSKIGYHTNDRLNSFEANINMLIGKRSNGKSYGTLAFDGVKEFLDSNYDKAFAYARRKEIELKKVQKSIFRGVLKHGWLEWYTSGEWNDIQYWQNCWYLRRLNADREVEAKCPTPMAYAYSVSTSLNDKGPDIEDIKTLILDEFIPLNYTYIPHEMTLWNNLISTLDRSRNKLKIYMIANTIQKECPYFEYYHIDPDKLEKGKIYVGKAGTIGKLAIEYCADEGDPETRESVFFNDDDEIGQMILSGEWQNRRFPSLPKDINLEERAMYSFYVLVRDKLMRGTFLSLGDTSTIYFERADDYKLDIDELLFVDDQYLDSMMFKNIIVRFDTSNNIARTVLKYLNQGRCFYDNDDTGEKIAYFAQL